METNVYTKGTALRNAIDTKEGIDAAVDNITNDENIFDMQFTFSEKYYEENYEEFCKLFEEVNGPGDMYRLKLILKDPNRYEIFVFFDSIISFNQFDAITDEYF